MGTELSDDWEIEDPNEEWYNPTKGPKGTWMPEGKVILELLERIQKEKVFELKWKCPGRRPPPSSQPVEEMETEADFDEEEIEEEKEEDKSTAFGEFDFDDAPSEVSKITPRRTPGSAKASRPQKRVACMDNVLNKMRTQRKQNEAARANKGIRGRRLPIYSTGSPRSRFGLSPSHAGNNQFKSSPLARPFPTAKSPVSSVPKLSPTPTPPPVSKPTPPPVPKLTPMEVDQDLNQKLSSTTQRKEFPMTTSQSVMSNQSAMSWSVTPSESSVITSVATSVPSPSVKAKVVQSTPSIPAVATTTPPSTPPLRPTVPPLRLSVTSALQSQIQAAFSSASQNTQKEYREPIPKLLLKIPPPSANQPATSMLLPPGYSRTSPGNKNKTSPGSQNRKSPNQLGIGSQHGSSPVLKHNSKTPPLYQNAPQTPPGYSSGQKTPPLHHGGNRSPAFNHSAPKTPPVYQNISQPLTQPTTNTGSKTPPAFQNRSKTPPGGVRTQSPQIYQSGSKTPPIYPLRNSPFSPQNFSQSQSVRPPAQGHVIRPNSPAPRGNRPHPLQTFPRQQFHPRTTPSPMGSPRGQQPLQSPSRFTPQSPSAHTTHPRSPFYPNFSPLPMEQSQTRPPFHKPPQQRQTRPKTPPAYHTVMSRGPPRFPPPAPAGGRSPGANAPINRAPIQTPFKVEGNMGSPGRGAHQNPSMVSNSNPTQLSQSSVPRFQRKSPPTNERQTPAQLPRPQLPTRHLPPTTFPSQATVQQHAKVTTAEHYVPSQQQQTTTVAESPKTVPVQQTNVLSTVQQSSVQPVNATSSKFNSQEKSTNVSQEQQTLLQQTSMSATESQSTSQPTNTPIPAQQTVPSKQVNPE